MHGSDSQHYLEEAMAAPAKGMSSDRTCLSRRLLIDLGIHLVAVWAAGHRRNSGPRVDSPFQLADDGLRPCWVHTVPSGRWCRPRIC
jgi:hypothetical protein